MFPLFLVGALSVVVQVVLLRELNVAFFGVELAYLLALAAWLMGTAAGASLLPRRLAPSRMGVAWALVIVAVSLPFDVAFIRGSRRLLGGLPGAFLPIEQQALVLAAAVLPPAILLGLLFRWAAQRLSQEVLRLTRAYAVESLGAAVSGLAVTLAFASGAQTFTVAIATGVAALAAASLAAPSRKARLAAGALGAAAAVALVASGKIDASLTRLNHPSLIFTSDSPYGRITVTSFERQQSAYENDVLVHESGSREEEALAHLTALQHPTAARRLVLGGTLKGLDDLLAAHGPGVVTLVEMDPVVAGLWKPDRSNPLAAGVSRRLVLSDARAFLRQPATFDVIVVGAVGPESGLDNRFFTREFFAACADRMAPDGVLGVALPLPDGFLSPLALLRAASVVRALEATFPVVQILPATTTVAIASRAPLPGTADAALARLVDRRLEPRLVRPAYVRYAYGNERRQRVPAAIAASGAVANSDVRPVCYQHAAVLWLSKFFPALQRMDAVALASPGRWPPLAWIVPVAALCSAIAAARLRPRLRGALLAGLAGFAGMVLETVALLEYQACSGALFEHVGVLVAAFMGGLATGAWAVARLAQMAGSRHLTAAALTGLAAVAGFVASGLMPGLSGSTPLSLAAAAVRLAVVGAAVSALFGRAAAGRDDALSIGRLYGADVAGGAAGAVAASLLLVPLAGLSVTAWVVAALALLALVAV